MFNPTDLGYLSLGGRGEVNATESHTSLTAKFQNVICAFYFFFLHAAAKCHFLVQKIIATDWIDNIIMFIKSGNTESWMHSRASLND